MTKYYYFGGQRVAMRQGNTRYYLHGDHLGSVSLATNASGALVREARYDPWGEVRWSNGAAVTDYGFTGQRGESIGLLDYNARFYNPRLGRFVQADNIVPEATQGTQAWDRYAYVNNNPVRYRDPSGKCIEPDDLCIAGWKDDYMHAQIGYTCAPTSLAVAASIVTGNKITLQDVQHAFPLTKFPSEKYGIGVPPKTQANIMNSPRSPVPSVKATYSQGTREDILNNITLGKPTVVSVAFPYSKGVGHALLMIGYRPSTEEFIYFDPAWNRKIIESEFQSYWGGFTYSRSGSFNDAWTHDRNHFIPSRSMVTLWGVPMINFRGSTGAGGNNDRGHFLQ